MLIVSEDVGKRTGSKLVRIRWEGKGESEREREGGMEWAMEQGFDGKQQSKQQQKRSGEGEDLLSIYLVRGKKKDVHGPLNRWQGVIMSYIQISRQKGREVGEGKEKEMERERKGKEQRVNLWRNALSCFDAFVNGRKSKQCACVPRKITPTA